MAKGNVAFKRTESVLGQLERMRDEIRRRAYELFLRNGSTYFNPLEDWLNTERDLIIKGNGVHEHASETADYRNGILRITAPLAEVGRPQFEVGSER